MSLDCSNYGQDQEQQASQGEEQARDFSLRTAHSDLSCQALAICCAGKDSENDAPDGDVEKRLPQGELSTAIQDVAAFDAREANEHSGAEKRSEFGKLKQEPVERDEEIAKKRADDGDETHEAGDHFRIKLQAKGEAKKTEYKGAGEGQ